MKHIHIFFLALLLASCSPAAVGQSPDGYSRALFPHWLDVDGDGLDARQQALARTSLRHALVGIGMVQSGLWLEPYSCTTVTDPAALDVDHVVPLKWAWDHGASTWTAEKRMQFANDQANLVPVAARANRQKSASGPDEWLPSCLGAAEYRRWFVEVCRGYGLEGCPE